MAEEELPDGDKCLESWGIPHISGILSHWPFGQSGPVVFAKESLITWAQSLSRCTSVC